MRIFAHRTLMLGTAVSLLALTNAWAQQPPAEPPASPPAQATPPASTTPPPASPPAATPAPTEQSTPPATTAQPAPAPTPPAVTAQPAPPPATAPAPPTPAPVPPPAASAPPPAAPAPAQAAAPGRAGPPGSALYDQPPTEGAKRLAPIAPPPIPTALDKLPTDKIKAPRGFKVEVYASGVPNARSMRLGDNGTLFVSTRLAGNVYAIVDNKGKREVKTIAKGLHRPNGLAFHKGALYVAELSKVWRYDDIEKNLDNPPKPVLISDKFPTDEPHGWKFIGIGPDNKLYVPIGAPCNICMPSDAHALIQRMDLDGSNVEVIARGVRNTVGFDWHPTTKELYFTDNGRDWLSEDVPHDELNRVTNPGKDHFGFPYCHQGDLTDNEQGWGRSCNEFVKPVALLGPHTAALGMRFYTGTSFPQQYRNAAFIARHGAWNRSVKIGGDVVVAQFNRDGTVRSIEPFLTGFLENNNYIGRPVDVLQMKDGALLVSDDYNGAIWRVSHGAPRTASGEQRRRPSRATQ